MIIKQIKISNFRSYYNDVTIDFDSKKDKNITLISGKNGFGKTSFLTSLIWGFYGKLMSKVEDKYRTEIKGSGGYENFLLQQFNRNQKNKTILKVEIILIDILIKIKVLVFNTVGVVLNSCALVLSNSLLEEVGLALE